MAQILAMRLASVAAGDLANTKFFFHLLPIRKKDFETLVRFEVYTSFSIQLQFYLKILLRIFQQ